MVVDDSSTDGSREIQRLIKGITFIEHYKNRGKGAAVRTALSHVTGDIIIIQDADLEYDPCDNLKLLTPIIAGKADVVYGSI